MTGTFSSCADAKTAFNITKSAMLKCATAALNQQAARIPQQHLAVIGQGHRPGGPAKQRALGDEFKAFDLLTDGRLREVQPIGRAVVSPWLFRKTWSAPIDVTSGSDETLAKAAALGKIACLGRA